MISRGISVASGLAALILGLLTFGSTASLGQSIDIDQAKAAFSQAEQLSNKDAGRLWGRALYGPMIFASPSTKQAVANQAGDSSVLHEKEGVWIGTLPANIIVANTAFWWAGKHWTMVMWPVPSNPLPRARLLAHEMYHRLQDDLHLPARNAQNPQLDTFEGRLWLQLEWRALALALISNGAEQRQAIADALTFRAERHSLLPGTTENERLLEINEGLAEYTGYALYAPDAASARWRLESDLVNPQAPTFVRSFAYLSGPAYGLLLDERFPSWRAKLNANSDLGIVLGSAITKAPMQTADQRALTYGVAALTITERERAAATAALQAQYRHTLVDGPVLILPDVGHFNFGFDPNSVIALPGAGNVYPTMHISDDWGTLDVEGGVLLPESGKWAAIPAPKDIAGSHIEGEGWKLDLADGWRLGPASRPGDYTIAKE